MFKKFLPVALSCLTLNATWPAAAMAQSEPASDQASEGPAAASDQAPVLYGEEQLDSLLAPIALYPDQLLTQCLLAATFPLQVVEASRWVQDPAHKNITGPALETALQPLGWDPSVKSLVPFPSVLVMMNSKLDWMQQIGYAFGVQQADVLASVQRLRLQAQRAGHLQTSSQQIVRAEAETIIIEPAQPSVVYVPSYNPTVVYGTWGYPSYPPVYLPPPVGYYPGNALVAGVAFGVGVAVVGSLWGWARPSWGYGYGHGGGYGYGRGGGYVSINHNVYNNITVNNIHRNTVVNGRWAGNGQPMGGFNRPPSGPAGLPNRRPPSGWKPPGGGQVPPGFGHNNGGINGGNNPNRPQLPPGARPNGAGNGTGNGFGNGMGNRPGNGQGGNLHQGGNYRPNQPGQPPAGLNGQGNRPNLPAANRPNLPNEGQLNGNRPNGGQIPRPLPPTATKPNITNPGVARPGMSKPISPTRPANPAQLQRPTSGPAPQVQRPTPQPRTQQPRPQQQPPQMQRPTPQQRPAAQQMQRPSPQQRPAPQQAQRPAPQQAQRPAPQQAQRPAPQQRPSPQQAQRPNPQQRPAPQDGKHKPN